MLSTLHAGMLKVEGLMPARCGMFDTPGVPHSHQLAAKLDPEEVGNGTDLFRVWSLHRARLLQAVGITVKKDVLRTLNQKYALGAPDLLPSSSRCTCRRTGWSNHTPSALARLTSYDHQSFLPNVSRRVLHCCQQVRMLLPRKTLKPRTFRIAPGQTVLLGGVARFDVISAPAATVYLTLWASADIVTHFGKTEAATEK